MGIDIDINTTASATTKHVAESESGDLPELQVQVQEIELDEETQTPIKRIKLKRVPSASALHLARLSSVVLQRAASMTLRKRGKKNRKSGWHLYYFFIYSYILTSRDVVAQTQDPEHLQSWVIVLYVLIVLKTIR